MEQDVLCLRQSDRWHSMQWRLAQPPSHREIGRRERSDREHILSDQDNKTTCFLM